MKLFNVVFDLFMFKPIFLLTRARWEPRPEDDGGQAEQKTPRPHLASLFFFFPLSPLGLDLFAFEVGTGMGPPVEFVLK